MSAQVGRNDPCPCGSGKKYKQCCQATGRPVAPEGIATEPRIETWKILVVGLGSILLVAVVLWLAGMPRIAQIVGGLATMLLIIYSAFRAPPTRREKPGDAAGINFGR